MSNEVLVISDKELLTAFNSLTSRQCKAQLRKSAKQALKILQKEAGKTIRKATRKNGKRIKFISLRKGIKLMGYKKKVGANVNLFGDYRTKWFETGTYNRYTKGNRYTGSIKQSGFFTKATNNKIGAVYDDFEKRVVENIVSTFNKKV